MSAETKYWITGVVLWLAASPALLSALLVYAHGQNHPDDKVQFWTVVGWSYAILGIVAVIVTVVALVIRALGNDVDAG